MSVYGRIAKYEYTILRKLKKAGAVSKDLAVTPQEAKFDFEEKQWLKYVAGGTFSKVKKSENGKYYIYG